MKMSNENNIDFLELLIAPSALLSAMALGGIGGFSGLGTDLMTTFDFGGVAVPLAFVTFFLSYLVALITNGFRGKDWRGLGPIDRGLFGSAIGTALGVTFVPAINSFVVANDLVGAGFFAASFATYALIAWR